MRKMKKVKWLRNLVNQLWDKDYTYLCSLRNLGTGKWRLEIWRDFPLRTPSFQQIKYLSKTEDPNVRGL